MDLAKQVSGTLDFAPARSYKVAAVRLPFSMSHAQSRLSVAHQSRRVAVVYPPLSRGVFGFSPPPVWLTESVPATAPRDFDAGNAAWFFSREWLYALEGDSNSQWETRKPDWWFASSGRHTAATQRVKAAPPFLDTGAHPPCFLRRGDVGLLSAQARGPASGGPGLPKNRVQGGIEARAWSL